MSRYLELLAASSQRVGSSLCVGIDPDPAHLAPEHAASVAGLRVWVRLLVTATAQYAAAYKVNLAFFEAYGAEGVALAEEIRARTPAETPIIMDVKRGDIGNTVKAQARALFDALGADAVTASPYLGIGALAPLLERDDRFVYLLCRTSNPESAELQELRLTATEAPQALLRRGRGVVPPPNREARTAARTDNPPPPRPLLPSLRPSQRWQRRLGGGFWPWWAWAEPSLPA
jgi:orotidine 5'-phosphate decarboxylase subfamily 2